MLHRPGAWSTRSGRSGPRPRIVRPGRAAAVALAGGALAIAGCSSSGSPATEADGSPAVSVALATSIATPQDSWAVLPMSSGPAYWQVFVRPAGAPSWRLDTPPGVADNGGLVASAGAATSLTVAVRPSQDLRFSPLARTSDGGRSWSTAGPIGAPVAASPGALAADGGRLVTLLNDGTIETSSDAGTTWSAIARPGAIAASAAGKRCGGAVRVTSVSFGITAAQVIAGGTCGTAGATAVFSYASGAGWRRTDLPTTGQLLRLNAGSALVRGKAGLTALFGTSGWTGHARLSGSASASPTSAAWTASAALPVSGSVIATGAFQLSESWVLLSGGRAARTAWPGQQWVLLPPVPLHTAVLAAGPAGATDALAVSGDTLTVWRLAPKATAWSKVQAIGVPIQSGSSG